MDFTARVLAWYRRHGRHDLPWQVPDPYLRWLAEIMLQQTTVTAARPYFERFRARFPTLEALAQAPLDDVLALWSGLGYYARARNLHATAQLVMDRHQGRFPQTLPELLALPGIGLSTAGAILAFAFGVPAPILDANVRRVLSRYHGITDRDAKATRRLWDYAGTYTPTHDVADYTQAIMDLGALVCRRTPECSVCPLVQDCLFKGEEARPTRRARPERSVVMALVYQANAGLLLMRRPAHGVWGGLWSLPECPALSDLLPYLASLGFEGTPGAARVALRHVFTHFALSITPVPVLLTNTGTRVSENRDMMWYRQSEPRPGMPAPVTRLVNQFLEIP